MEKTTYLFSDPEPYIFGKNMIYLGRSVLNFFEITGQNKYIWMWEMSNFYRAGMV